MGELKKYKPYEFYSDTNAVWYKQKPVHWVCERFKYSFSEKKKKNATELPAGSISFGEVILKNEDNLSQDTKESYQEVLAGEFLINPLNLNFDLKSLRTALSTINVVVSTGYIVLQGCGLLHSRFARWLLQQFDVSHMKTLGAGVRQTINYADIGNSLFCRPTLKEQKIIAAFLDHETAKIDNLIEKQQQLIELLKEKRQAVISYAVTKGLNPDVPMKDSGVEWLGEVPEHWKVSSLGYYSSLNTGATPDRSNSKYWNGEIAWIKTGEVNYNNICSSEEKITWEAVKNTSVRLSPPGTLLMAMYGQGITRGRVAILDISATYNQACVAISPSETLLNVYLRLFFIAGYHAIRDGGNETSQMNLNADIVRKFKILVPPLSEQKEIVSYLDCHLPQIEMLVERADSVIALLQERRTALISAAVTGKIDVRDWVAPALNDAEVPQEATA
ncbi:restriction endonuclease subunit S [Enterobacter asburiae]